MKLETFLIAIAGVLLFLLGFFSSQMYEKTKRINELYVEIADQLAQLTYNRPAYNDDGYHLYIMHDTIKVVSGDDIIYEEYLPEDAEFDKLSKLAQALIKDNE